MRVHTYLFCDIFVSSAGRTWKREYQPVVIAACLAAYCLLQLSRQLIRIASDGHKKDSCTVRKLRMLYMSLVI